MALSGNYAWDVLKIGEELDLLEAGIDQKGANDRSLAAADFESNIAAGSQCGKGGGDEAAIDLKAVVAGKECEGGLVVAHFDGQ